MPYNLKQRLLMILITVLLSTCALAEYDPNNFDPANAAHWYRKAFALYEEPNGIDLIGYAQGEIETTPEIERFLKSQKPVIDLISKATKIELCDWEFDPLANGTYMPNPYVSGAKDILYLLLADTLYEERHCPGGYDFGNFEPIFRLASHTDSAEMITHFVSLAIRAITYEAIRDTLNRNPDIDLSNLKKAQRLIRNESIPNTILYSDIVNKDVEKTKRILTNYALYIYPDHYWTQEMGIPAEKLSDDFYKRNLRFYEDYMCQFQNFLDLPYPQAHNKITELGGSLNLKARDYFADYREQLRNKIEEKISYVLFETNKGNLNFKDMEPSMMLSGVPVEILEKCDFLYTVFGASTKPILLSEDTRVRTKRNALEVGIELLIRYRTTKILPEKINLCNPKDLFSDRPFLIIKTDDGFNLKCQGEDLSKNKVHEYEFKLPKE